MYIKLVFVVKKSVQFVNMKSMKKKKVNFSSTIVFGIFQLLQIFPLSILG